MRELKVPDINYQNEIKKCKTMDDVVGKMVSLHVISPILFF